MPDRSRAARSALLGPVLLAIASCTAAPAAKPARGVAADLLPFLADPAPLGLGSAGAEAVALHRRLLSGEDPGELVARTRELAGRTARPAGVQLLLAEALLVAGQPEAARSELALIPRPLADATPVRLLDARAAEAVQDWIGAAEGYRAAAGESGAAAARLATVDARATTELLQSVETLVARGRISDASAALERLERWHPTDERTLEAARALARTAKDPGRELNAVRALAAAHPGRADLARRRGVLEVEIGDAAVGVALLQALATKSPDDAGLAADLLRAKFLFRLANAPEEVRRAAVLPQLTRADFARLLYWLVPEVRTSRGGVARIATDILDDPAREEIVRVANLGLLDVDESLHLFEPGRALRRGEAFRALRLVAAARRVGACGEIEAGGVVAPCELALRCGWIPEAGECLPFGPVAGSEATEWIRSVAEPLEGGS